MCPLVFIFFPFTISNMPECLERRVKEHPRAAVTHHFPDFLPHFMTITMYAAFPARLFTVTERTTVQPGLRISQKCFAFGTKPFCPMPATAVQPYHKLHRILFFPYLPHFPYPPHLLSVPPSALSFCIFFLHIFSLLHDRFHQTHTKIAITDRKHGLADISDYGRKQPAHA